MSRVGEKIKEARLKSGMTQKALAKKLGVAEKYINEVEMGRKVVQESFIDRAAKILKVDLNDVSMVVTDEALMEERKNETFSKKPAKIEVNELWNDAFSSVLKSVPVYGYGLNAVKGRRELPVHSNKIEGFPQDKVLYIEIEDSEMSGFRMMQGDLAFAHLVKEISNNETIFSNKTFVLTGSLERFTRDEAKEKIESLGGICSSSGSTKSNVVIAGN